MVKNIPSKLISLSIVSFIIGFIISFFLSVVIVFTYCQNIVSIQYIKPCKVCNGSIECYESFVDGYIYEECKTCEMVNIHECD